MSSKKEDRNDLFDRSFFGKPGCMIIALLAIIAFFLIKNLL